MKFMILFLLVCRTAFSQPALPASSSTPPAVPTNAIVKADLAGAKRFAATNLAVVLAPVQVFTNSVTLVYYTGAVQWLEGICFSDDGERSWTVITNETFTAADWVFADTNAPAGRRDYRLCYFPDFPQIVSVTNQAGPGPISNTNSP